MHASYELEHLKHANDAHSFERNSLGWLKRLNLNLWGPHLDCPCIVDVQSLPLALGASGVGLAIWRTFSTTLLYAWNFCTFSCTCTYSIHCKSVRQH